MSKVPGSLFGVRFLSVPVLLAGIGGAAAQDMAYGAHLAAGCATCHRAGSGTQAIPALQGMTRESIVAAMQAYRNGSRHDLVMASVARSLDEAGIEAVATFLSSEGTR